MWRIYAVSAHFKLIVNGEAAELSPMPTELVQQVVVIFVQESLF
jgi:hypothetical protein